MKSKKKGIVAPGLIILAFVASIAVFAVMLYTEKKLLSEGEKGTVYIAKEEIPAGTKLSAADIGKYIEIAEVPVELIPNRYVAADTFFSGMMVSIPISNGSILSEDMFRETEVGTDGMKEPVLLGFKAEDMYQVIGGTLRKGDKIHLYSDDEFGEVTLRWSNLYIADAFDSAGNVIEYGEEGKAVRFNIYIEKKDVEEFFSQLDSKQLRLVKVCE